MDGHFFLRLGPDGDGTHLVVNFEPLSRVQGNGLGKFAGEFGALGEQRQQGHEQAKDGGFHR